MWDQRTVPPISVKDMNVKMNSGIFFQHGNWTNPSITGHIDAMYNRIPGGHIYQNQYVNILSIDNQQLIH